MSKVKQKKELDYSLMPDHVWEKQYGEFIEFMNQLAAQVDNAWRMGQSIQHAANMRSSDDNN